MNDPVNRYDIDGHLSLPNWAKVAIGVGVIGGLAAATVLTGGTAGIIAGAALSGAVSGGLIGAGIGAVVGGLSDGIQGAIDGACSGFMEGTIFGGGTAALSSGLSIATGAVEVVGKAQKTKTLFHDVASRIQAGKMAARPLRFSKITLDRSLKTVGLIGKRRPDVIGVARNGKHVLVEVVSKSQTPKQMADKCVSMIAENGGCAKKVVVTWARTISRFLK